MLVVQEKLPISAQSRRAAGASMSCELVRLEAERPIVLGLPRGGVPVAYEVARALGAPLDVLVVRRLSVPEHPEATLGAVCEGGLTLLDEAVVELSGAARHDIEELVAEAKADVDTRARRLRGERPMPDVTGRLVLLVDDGLATGRTALAAVKALHSMGAGRIVLIAPVAAARAASFLEARIDELFVGRLVPALGKVGAWFADSRQVSDDEVIALLARARAELPQRPPSA